MILRLFSLVDGSNDADVAVRALKSVIDLPQVTSNSDADRDRLLEGAVVGRPGTNRSSVFWR